MPFGGRDADENEAAPVQSGPGPLSHPVGYVGGAGEERLRVPRAGRGAESGMRRMDQGREKRIDTPLPRPMAPLNCEPLSGARLPAPSVVPLAETMRTLSAEASMLP